MSRYDCRPDNYPYRRIACLPGREKPRAPCPALAGGIFEQPEKDDFFSNLVRPMLRAIPKSWFSWDYRVFEGSQHVADIDLSFWGEKGLLTVQDEAYQVSREGLMSGAFILEAAGRVLARAEKPSAFRRCFFIEHDGRLYTLRASSALRREFVLLDDSEQIGSVSPEGIFTHRASADLPEKLPLPVRLFIIWLTVILWRRNSDPNTAGGGSA